MSPPQVRALIFTWMLFWPLTVFSQGPPDLTELAKKENENPQVSTATARGAETQSQRSDTESTAQTEKGAIVPPESRWLKKLYTDVRASVVRVETDRGIGTGFLFHSSTNIATAYHVIANATHLQVVLTNGAVIQATVAAHDESLDLAILKLSLPVKDALVLVPEEDVQIGSRVAAIGHPLSLYTHVDHRMTGLLDWSLTSGIVGALSPYYVQTDAAVNPGNSGGPLLSERGRVVGIVSFQLRESQGVNVAVRAQLLEKLVKKLGRQEPPPRDTWNHNAVEIGYMGHYGSHTLKGISVGLDLTALSKISVATRLGVLNGRGRPGGPGVINQRVDRTTIELETGYRFGFDSAPPQNGFALGVGGAVQFQTTETTRLEIAQRDPACDQNCAFISQGQFEKKKTVRFLPMLTGSLTLAPLRIGYAYQLDVVDTSDSIHRLFLGLVF